MKRVTDEELVKALVIINTSSTINGPHVSLRLGHVSALALSTQFTAETPLRYPLEKAFFVVRLAFCRRFLRIICAV